MIGLKPARIEFLNIKIKKIFVIFVICRRFPNVHFNLNKPLKNFYTFSQAEASPRL